MSAPNGNDDKDRLAKKAAEQGKQAAKNAAKAASLTAEEAADGVVDHLRHVDTQQLSRGLSDTGQGFIALSVSITAATFALRKFRQVWAAKQG